MIYLAKDEKDIYVIIFDKLYSSRTGTNNRNYGNERNNRNRLRYNYLR